MQGYGNHARHLGVVILALIVVFQVCVDQSRPYIEYKQAKWHFSFHTISTLLEIH